MAATLHIQGLEKNYGEKKVLSSVNYSFEEGNIYGILGRNGAGKTTLFNCINGDVSFEGGSITIADGECSRGLLFEDVGLVSASPSLPEFLTGYEFIFFFTKLNAGALRHGRSIDDYFELVRITKEDRFRLIKSYSYGMKNKLQLLCCLIRKPKVILLDEPLSSFDIIVSHDIKELLLEMKAEHIILMSTHILQLASDVSDEIVLLHNGALKHTDRQKLHDADFEQYIIEALKDGE